ncbi:hypothetical protein DFH53_001666 [Clostridium beijerinckii]|nr:hypothetical protein [Clostridium beijerinckii]
MMLTKIFGSSETLFSFDTYQFEDYSKVVTSVDPEKKAKNTQRSVPAEIKE